MRKYVIITDTNCELNKELRERFHIDHVIPAHVVTNDGVDHLTDNDWILFKTPEDLYKELRDRKSKCSTSPANITELKEAFKTHLDKGEDIIFLALSAAMSGTYNFALMAKNELLEEYPDAKIEILDSKRYSLALGLLTIEAARLRDEGKTIEECIKQLEIDCNRVHEVGPMDDLFFLSKKGRISSNKAFFGTMVGVKPMGDFNRHGMTTVITKVLGIKKAIATAVEYMKRTIENPEEQIIFIANTDREKQAQMLKDAILAAINVKEVIMVTCGPSTAVNVGPGLYAAFYYGKEISEDNVEEIQIMKEITGK